MDEVRKLKFMAEVKGAFDIAKVTLSEDKKNSKILNVLESLKMDFVELSIGDLSITEELVEVEEREIDERKHKPRDVAKFLRLFATSDLKYLTHVYDKGGEVFELDKIIENARIVFKTETTRKYIIPQSLWARINIFLNGIEASFWVFNGRKYSLKWNSKEVSNWCSNNPLSHPLNFAEFANNAIYPFKQSIEVKSPQLEELIKQKAINTLGNLYRDFAIDYIDLDKPSFYTDVDKLLAGIGNIFQSIKQRYSRDLNKIVIRFEKKIRGVRLISISHLNSKCDKPLNMDLLGGDLLDARNNFYQICDWSILASNKGEHNKLNILSESIEIPRSEFVEEKITGFTHILKIYAF